MRVAGARRFHFSMNCILCRTSKRSHPIYSRAPLRQYKAEDWLSLCCNRSPHSNSSTPSPWTCTGAFERLLTVCERQFLPTCSRYRTEAHADIVARFNERFILSLSDCRAALVVDDQLNVLPITKHMQVEASPVEEASNVRKKRHLN